MNLYQQPIYQLQFTSYQQQIEGESSATSFHSYRNTLLVGIERKFGKVPLRHYTVQQLEMGFNYKTHSNMVDLNMYNSFLTARQLTKQYNYKLNNFSNKGTFDLPIYRTGTRSGLFLDILPITSN